MIFLFVYLFVCLFVCLFICFIHLCLEMCKERKEFVILKGTNFCDLRHNKFGKLNSSKTRNIKVLVMIHMVFKKNALKIDIKREVKFRKI